MNTTVPSFKNIKSEQDSWKLRVNRLIIKAGATDKVGVIFIEKNKAGDFESLAQREGDKFKAPVTDAFFFGSEERRQQSLPCLL